MLEDAAHELVYYVSQPPRAGDDVTLSAWADLHRAEERGEAPEGAVLVDVRLMDSSWGRLMALAIDAPLDDFDRVAVERAALAVAIDLLGQQHEEHLRARSRGAFLSDLADDRVEEADARRRAEALGFPGSGRGELLPLAASWRGSARASRPRGSDGESWTRLSGELRTALGSTGLGVLIGPRDADLLVLLALGGRAYDEALAEHVAGLFHGVLERRGLGAAGRGAGDRRAGRRLGAPPGRGCGGCGAPPGAATALPPRRWYDARRPGVTDLLHDLRDAPEVDAFVDEQLGPLLADGSARSRALLETLEAYLAAGGRKAQAARALHLERQSLYLRLRRIEELLGVSLDDEDAVLSAPPRRCARCGSGGARPRLVSSDVGAFSARNRARRPRSRPPAAPRSAPRPERVDLDLAAPSSRHVPAARCRRRARPDGSSRRPATRAARAPAPPACSRPL